MKRIIYAIVCATIIISSYWLWHADRLQVENAEWCLTQEVYQYEVCGAKAERDIQRTVYLKVLMFSFLVFGSTSLVLKARKIS